MNNDKIVGKAPSRTIKDIDINQETWTNSHPNSVEKTEPNDNATCSSHK